MLSCTQQFGTGSYKPRQPWKSWLLGKFLVLLLLLLQCVLSYSHNSFQPMLMVGQALQIYGKVFITKSREEQRKVLEKENFQALWYIITGEMEQSSVLSTALD